MTSRTYADAVGAMREWINSRTATLVGVGFPLQQGAHLKRISGGAPAAYAYIEDGFSLRSDDSPESPDLIAAMSAQIYADTREAATAAAVALAEEISTQLDGRPWSVTGATIYAADDIQGPSFVPDGERPRLLLNGTVRVRPV